MIVWGGRMRAKKGIITFFTTILMLLFITTQCIADSKPSVHIDAGHGGSETGAVSDGILEKEWNLDTARACAKELKKYGVYVYETRNNDTFVSIADRYTIANKNGVDYFISIHHNASDGGADRGEVIYGTKDKKSEELANEVKKELQNRGQTEVKTYTRLNSRGTDYYGVIRGSNMSAIIVEVCFIDNKKDREIANTKEKREKNGVAIAHAILKQLDIPVNDTIKKQKQTKIKGTKRQEQTEIEGTLIMNNPTVDYEQIVKWAENNGASEEYMKNIPYIWEQCKKKGVDPVVVATQCALETNFMRSELFKKSNNTAGMKETSNTYQTFNSVQEGLDAQIDHLMLYAGAIQKDSWLCGWCKTVEELTGTWAEDSQYSKKLLTMINDIKNTKISKKESKIKDKITKNKEQTSLKEKVKKIKLLGEERLKKIKERFNK